MVLIDTSVWIQLYRKKTVPIGERVWALVGENEAAICGQVYTEFLSGFKKKDEFAFFEEKLSRFPWLETNQKIFQTAAKILVNHKGLGLGDAIIAATALVWNVPLLTLDKGFHNAQIDGLKIED